MRTHFGGFFFGYITIVVIFMHRFIHMARKIKTPPISIGGLFFDNNTYI